MIRDMAFIRVKYTLMSPLCIGSGEADTTDHDVLTDEDEKPFVPGTSLAGLFRHVMDKELINKLLGYIDNTQARKSPVSFFDGHFEGNITKAVRDGVKLDEHKTVVESSKYDYQVIDPGVSFIADMEIRLSEDDMPMDDVIREIDRILTLVNDGAARMGYKANRGLGKLSAERAVEIFSKDNLIGSLDFDWETADPVFEKPSVAAQSPYTWIEVRKAKIRGGISVRHYSTIKNAPDFSPLKVHDGTEDAKVVIPGSSIAGALRNQMKLLLEEMGCPGEKENKALEELWGGKVSDERFKPSRCIVEESTVTGGRVKRLTRTKVDRFTGAAAHGALYTEEVQIGGETALRIGVPCRDWMIALMIFALKDIQNGIATFGGSAAIGRGIVSFETIYIGDDALTDDKERELGKALAEWILFRGGEQNAV